MRSPRPPFLSSAGAVRTPAAVIEEPFQRFAGFPVRAFVTTRRGGVSEPPFDSLNVAYLTDDRRENVRENRERVAAALEVAHDELLIGRQVHGGQVKRAEDVVLGETPGDGILLTRAGTAAMIVAADCLPLIFYDPGAHTGLVAHAGWRGLAAGVIENGIATLVSAGATPGEVIVGLGPAIGRCCYEVGPEVIAAVEPIEGEYDPGKGDRSMLDLKAMARRRLQEGGIDPGKVEDLAICTRCRQDLYYSARGGEPTGRFAAGLKLLEG